MIGKIKFKTWFHSLRPVDILIIGFTHILSLLSVILSFGTMMSVYIVATNLLLAAFIIRLGKTVENSSSKIIRGVQDWYPIPIIYFIFKEVHFIILGSERGDWDNIFIAIDRAIFGVDPTVWFTQFATPLLTEILQIAYTSYYFIMLAVGFELYIRKDQEKFLFAVFTVVYGFALSYLGYLAFPAVGPRFTLHDFYALNNELPGLWLTNCLRDFINAGESIPKGSLNALALAQRDVFPSGHTQMTIL
ncbi:MAG: phosphatase PAP2 family protein, partial [Bacteroidota bacterium]|nr:phosphatase PAP2 family protein [Bacteroidota bacterium]